MKGPISLSKVGNGSVAQLNGSRLSCGPRIDSRLEYHPGEPTHCCTPGMLNTPTEYHAGNFIVYLTYVVNHGGQIIDKSVFSSLHKSDNNSVILEG